MFQFQNHLKHLHAKRFLKVEVLTPEEPLPQDLEGNNSKLLLRAKSENNFFNQVLFLEKLSEFYAAKKKDLKMAAKLLNCAIAIQQSNLQNEQRENQLFLNLLAILENRLSESIGAHSAVRVTGADIQTRRQKLKQARDECEQAVNQMQGFQQIQKILTILTNANKALLAQLIEEAQITLGPSPCKSASLGLGSMSRGEMCPYSDLEYIIVTENDNPKTLDYFRKVAEIVEIKVINMGETPLSVFGPNETSPNPNGFCLDTAGGILPLALEIFMSSSERLKH